MDGTTTFGNLARAVEHLSGEFEKARVERETSETLIASAEYELELLKEAFAAARLDAPRTPPAHGLAPDPDQKLRKPQPEHAPPRRAALAARG
jgi:hypothetical protein